MKSTTESYEFIFKVSPMEAKRKFTAVIHPLGPLCMNSGPPMDFRKTDIVPTGKMLYGMFENLIGFHFKPEHRSLIVKQLREFYGKQFDILFQTTNNDKFFFPLIQHLLRFELVNNEEELISGAKLFNDYATMMNERQSSVSKELKSHYGGSKIYDVELQKRHKHISKNFENLSEREYEIIKDKLPRFYSKPVSRQYVIFDQDIILDCVTTDELYGLIKEKNKERKSLYLGHSESLIELEIK